MGGLLACPTTLTGLSLCPRTAPGFPWSVWPHPAQFECEGSQWAAKEIAIITNQYELFNSRWDVVTNVFKNLGGASEVYDVSVSLKSLENNVLERFEICDGENTVCVELNIENDDERVYHGMDENYYVKIGSNGWVEISASNHVGGMYAMESLSQLIRFDFVSLQHFMPKHCLVDDRPRFPHRGLLVDTSRHFLPVSFIKRIIDSLRMNKVNVLHWHIVDMQSWPYRSNVFPELSEKGAWSESEQYTVAEMKWLVNYAAKNGVRVVAELDQPGHTGGIYRSHPELFACTPPSCDQGANPSCMHEDGRWNGGDVALDPNNPDAFTFMFKLMDEFMDIFPDSYVHIGTDETPEKCYNGPTSHHRENSAKMFSKWVNTMHAYITTKHPEKTVVMWDEALNAKPSNKGTAIQIWRTGVGWETVKEAYEGGYQIIQSPAGGPGSWYLNDVDTSWQQVYTLEVVPKYVHNNKHNFIGGEGCVWGGDG